MVKNLSAIVGDTGLLPGLGKYFREGNGNPLQYSCLGNPMDGGAWWARVHGVAWIRHSSVQSLSRVRLFVTPWTAARQASLSITNFQSLSKPMSIESVIPSNHLILFCPLLLLPSTFPASGSFQMSQLFASGGQSTGVSASTSVLPMNTQDWPPLGWTCWISLQSKGLFKSLLQHHSSKASKRIRHNLATKQQQQAGYKTDH